MARRDDGPLWCLHGGRGRLVGEGRLMPAGTDYPFDKAAKLEAMHVLHISGDYPNSPLYRQMLIGIEGTGVVEQTMYVPRQKTETQGTCADSAPQNVAVVQSKDFTVLDRALYWPKRRKICRALSTKVSLPQIDGVHAHSLFSAGGVAQLLHEEGEFPT